MPPLEVGDNELIIHVERKEMSKRNVLAAGGWETITPL
jgi:hypothetical protein